MSIPTAIKGRAIMHYGLLKIRRRIELRRFYSLDDKGRKALVERQYLAKIGRPINWDHLESYTEKMQWEKLYHQDDRKVQLADKYLVRSWVKERIGGEYLVPLIGVWNQVEEIDFDKLPASFVLKTNCGSGDAIIVRNKDGLGRKDIKKIKEKLNYYLKYDLSATSCEMHYAEIAPKIIAEQYLDIGGDDLPDYKFICFDGKPYYCWVDMDRFSGHRRNIYDLNWNLQDWYISYPQYEGVIEKPKNFDRMIELAKALSDGFAHVRVDFYNINGKIYFGEMTFTSECGYGKVMPDEMDFTLGELWNID